MILKIGESLSFDKLYELVKAQLPLIIRDEVELLTISALQRRREPCVLRLLKNEDITDDLVTAVVQEKDIIVRLLKNANDLQDSSLFVHLMSMADGLNVGLNNLAFEHLLNVLSSRIIVERTAIEEHVQTLLSETSRSNRKPASQLEETDLTSEFIEKVVMLHKITSPYGNLDPSKC